MPIYNITKYVCDRCGFIEEIIDSTKFSGYATSCFLIDFSDTEEKKETVNWAWISVSNGWEYVCPECNKKDKFNKEVIKQYQDYWG